MKERMDGLIRISDNDKFIMSVIGMFEELEREGFEREDIKEFLKDKIDDIL